MKKYGIVYSLVGLIGIASLTGCNTQQSVENTTQAAVEVQEENVQEEVQVEVVQEENMQEEVVQEENVQVEDALQATLEQAPESQQAATPQENLQEQEVANVKGSKVLVVYFSRVGVSDLEEGLDANTSASLNRNNIGLVGNMELLADDIVEATGGDKYQIITEKVYPGAYSATTELAREEQRIDERPILKELIPSIDQYDTVFIGYPNWWGTLPQAVFTFLESYDFAGKTIIPFTSHEGSGFGRSIRDIEALCDGATILEGFSIRGSQAQGAQEAVTTWLEQLAY